MNKHYELIKNYKQIRDNIHGYIQISNVACAIIDTVEFQRLRYLHQLGTCHYVFPTAIHSRFEHSLGTYHLTGQLLDNIKKNTNIDTINKYIGVDKYQFDDYFFELIKVAGLCHDLGHGPFSYAFDDAFIPLISDSNNPNNSHEYRSYKILEHIVKNNSFLTSYLGKDLTFIQSLINPSKTDTGFVYQIISNEFNSIDVDKFDYLARDTKNIGLTFGFDSSRLISDAHVIDNIICFPEQMYHEVASIFTTRYRLYKQVYGHKIVVSIQYMICEIMCLLDKVIGIYDKINSVSEFCNLTDDYIISMVTALI